MERNLSSFSDSKLDQVMTAEQFDQIVEAILSGKYSWACVLILRFAGYNPLHYIPYRTYNRLKKDNKDNRVNSQSKKVTSKNERTSQASRKSSSRLRDLSYLEEIQDCAAKINGSNGWRWLYARF